MRILMKLLSLVTFSLFVFLPGLVLGQFTFTTSIATTNGPVVAKGNLDFDLDTGTVQFTVENRSPFMSEITGVWFMNPIVDGKASSADFAGVEHNDSGVTIADSSSDWKNSSSVDNGTWQLVRQKTSASKKGKNNYIGAQVSPSSAESLESTASTSDKSTFSFNVPELAGQSEFILGRYFSQQSVDQPAVVFRWQTVDPQFVDGGSAKGFAYIDLQISPIPEPSHIAALSVIGMAGLLYGRRRMIAQRRKRQTISPPTE